MGPRENWLSIPMNTQNKSEELSKSSGLMYQTLF